MDSPDFSHPSMSGGFSTPVEVYSPFHWKQENATAFHVPIHNVAVQTFAQENQNVFEVVNHMESCSVVPVSTMPPKRKSSESSLAANRTCRICLEGSETEVLINPCQCMGTAAFIHLTCLKKWLAYSGTSECDLCRFEFQTTRKIKPIREWQKIDLSTKSKEYIRLSIAIFLVLTPSFVCGLILATEKLKVYIGTPENFWKAVGMTALSAFSVSIYLIAIGYCLRRYNALFREWIAANQKVSILIPQKNGSRSNKMQPTLDGVSVHM